MRKKLFLLFLLILILLSWYLLYKQKNISDVPIKLTDSYYYDKNTLFFQGNKVCVADIKDIHTFPYSEKALQYIPEFIKNKFKPNMIKNVWITDASNYYISVGKKVYFWDQEIKGADVDSFTPIYSKYSMDKNNIYCNYQKLDLQKERFSFIEWTFNYVVDDYVTDGKKIYVACRLLTWADIETFALDIWLSWEMWFSHDKNHQYFMGRLYTWNMPSWFIEAKMELNNF